MKLLFTFIFLLSGVVCPGCLRLSNSGSDNESVEVAIAHKVPATSTSDPPNVDLIVALPSWSMGETIDGAAVERYVHAARLLQDMDESAIESLFAGVLAEERTDMARPARGAADGDRFLLLLPMMFEVDNDSALPQGAGGGGWLGFGVLPEERGRVAIWPLRVQDKKFMIAAKYQGYKGPPYDPLAHYRLLATRYQFRKLGVN